MEVQGYKKQDPGGEGCEGKGRRVGGWGKGSIFRRLRKKLTAVVEAVFGKRRLLMIFQDGCEKDMTLNQLIVVTVDKIPVTK